MAPVGLGQPGEHIRQDVERAEVRRTGLDDDGRGRDVGGQPAGMAIGSFTTTLDNRSAEHVFDWYGQRGLWRRRHGVLAIDLGYRLPQVLELFENIIRPPVPTKLSTPPKRLNAVAVPAVALLVNMIPPR